MTIDKIKVSVLMPNYNCEKYLKEAIESIIHQSFTDFEFIIIDDCSIDNSWKIIEDYAKKDTRIVAIKNEYNLGISGNRNKLLDVAQGKYIVWQDSDDISFHDRIEKQYAYMKTHPEVGACGGGLQFFDASGDTSKRLYAQSDEEIRKNIFRYSPVALPGSIMLKKAVIEAGKFIKDLNVSEDLHLSFRIGKKYKFGNLSCLVIKYRENGLGATHKHLKRMEIETIKIRWHNHKTKFYHMNLGDKIYNLLQFISIYIIPGKLKIKIFNFIRNS